MKRLHRALIIVFILSAALFGAAIAYKYYNTDTTIPEIRFYEDTLSVSVKDGRDALMLGVSAYDKKDGDITDKLILESVEMGKNGEVSATYAVCDADNHVVTRTRTIIYTDYVSPRFSLSAQLCYSPSSSIKVRDRLGAYDVIDGQMDNDIRINTNSLSPYYAGLYPVTFEVTNSLGDRVSLTLEVEIREMSDNEPEIVLDTYLIYLSEDEAKGFNAIEHVNYVNGAEKSDVRTSGTRLSTGVNRVKYYCQSESGVRGSTTLYVVVE